MTRLSDLFGRQKHIHPVKLAVATAGTELEEAAFVAPFNLTIDAVSIVPTTAIADDASNYVGVGIKNKGAAGTGTTVMAQRDFDAADGSDDVAAFDEATITLSATTANLNASEGDVISVDVTKGGTGESLDGIVIIEYHPRGQ